jgi:hypothetical protein
MNDYEQKALAALNAAIDRDIKMIANHPVRILDTVNTLANMVNIKKYIEANAAVPEKAPAKARSK